MFGGTHVNLTQADCRRSKRATAWLISAVKR
jgi:hypothetical protein